MAHRISKIQQEQLELIYDAYLWLLEHDDVNEQAAATMTLAHAVAFGACENLCHLVHDEGLKVKLEES